MMSHTVIIILWILVGLLAIEVLWGVEPMIDFFIGIFK